MEFSEIKGLGEKRIEVLKKAGFVSPADLLFFFPKKYIDTGALTDPKTARTGDEVVFCGVINATPVRKTVRKGLFFVRAEFEMEGGQKVSGVWFNNPYIKTTLKQNTPYYITGKVKRFGSRLEILSPELHATNGTQKIIPVYPRISGFSQSTLRTIVLQVLSKVAIRGVVPEDIRQEFKLEPLADIVKTLHAPSTMQDIETAQKSAALEMLGCDLAAFFLHKDSGAGNRVFEYKASLADLENIKNRLPYQLSDSQQTALTEIVSSLLSGPRMNRLLQGDVGSGKTIVALLTMYFAKLSGYQSVLMAPTEILARQHFETAVSLFGDCARICLLTGNQTKNERLDKLFSIKTGMVDFVIGTHALIQDDVEFAALSLVVTDEQQRFGVYQRGKLENKAAGTDCLILSATPIPRTLSLILYGELGQSRLEKIENRRAKVLTRLVPLSKIEDMYGYIESKASAGEKTFIVCPRIEDDDDETLFSTEQVYKQLKKRPEIATQIAQLHGKMKDEQKNVIMEKFSSDKINILVATTVVEVGIDVRDATTIIIFNPERYGLSQLHQLRGRVGRGEKDSYCFLVTDEPDSNERIKYFLATNDGFELAEYDFELRGAGDFLGTRQHGGAGGISYKITLETISTAKSMAQRLLSSPQTNREISLGIAGERISYIKNLTLS